MREPADDNPILWRPLSLVATLRCAASSAAARGLLLGWAVITLACVLLGIYQVDLAWNGLPVHFGGFHFSLTIYPPLIICLWMVFWVGFEWAFLTAYLATWILALYDGMPMGAALLFALVDPLALAVYALAYRAARIPFDLRNVKSVVWFVVVSFVAAVAGSTGSFIWSEAHGLSAGETLVIWQGWWVGAFLQALLLNAPILALASRRVERLKQRFFDAPAIAEPSLMWIATTIAAGGIVLAGFLIASSELASARLSQVLETSVGAATRSAIVDAAYSWKLTAWTGMALTLAGSLGGIFLAYAWNRTLFREVRARTAEVHETEQRFRVTFEQAAVGIAHVSPDGLWLRVNQKLCDIVGYPREELVRKTFQDITHPDDLASDMAFVQRVLAGEIDTYTMEKRYIRKSGSMVWAQLTVSLARGPHKEPRYFISIVEDITERKLLEEQLRQSQKMEAIGRLAGGVAHDFNNLLTVIAGYGEMMITDAGDNDSLRQGAEAICEASGRATALTSQLLAFSRRQVVQPRILDLNLVVGNMENMLQRLLGETVALTTIPSPSAAKVKVDPGQIEQVIVNLAVNAKDAMPGGGKLAIEVAAAESPSTRQVMLAIRDTGTGMSDEVQSHLFEPFYTTKPRGKGTGLGLSIVYGIVKQAGGSIAVDTQVGRGTTFRLAFPEVVSGDVYQESRPIPATLLPGSETILLVEDEDAVRKLAGDVLRNNGYKVLEAASGEAAVSIGLQFTGAIPLLVTDMIMPGMNGRALAEQLRAGCPGMKVLYISGYTENVLEINDLGPTTAFLQKPFGPSVLAQKVRELLDAPTPPEST
jgi:PAS domain S-box-containing protein